MRIRGYRVTVNWTALENLGIFGVLVGLVVVIPYIAGRVAVYFGAQPPGAAEYPLPPALHYWTVGASAVAVIVLAVVVGWFVLYKVVTKLFEIEEVENVE